MARPLGDAARWVPGRRGQIIIGFVAVVVVVIAIALLVGGPSEDAGTFASPTPSVDEAVPITFGTALDPATGAAIGETSEFGPGQTFAYSADPDGTIPTSVYVEVIRLGPGETETVQAPVEPQAVPEGSPLIAFEVSADALITAFGVGTFEMRIYRDPAEAPIARGRFTLVAPGASPG
jgi:hypothetical protein